VSRVVSSFTHSGPDRRGVWLFVSAFWLATLRPGRLERAIVGAIVFVFAALGMAAGGRRAEPSNLRSTRGHAQ
jgi:hypothetical protein